MEAGRPADKTPFERAMERGRVTEDGLPHPFEIGIPMRDGVELAASVYLPVDDSSADAAPAPAIVEITPYDKTGLADEATLYQGRGYAFVAVDCRGRGKSEGQWRAFFDDPADGHDVIEWVASQAWCDGKVGTTGLSYMGWTQWAAASERPPHLVCMVSNSAAGRWQQEIPYTNGCFQLFFGWWVFAVRRRIAERYRARHVDWDEVLRRVPLDAIGDFIDPSGPTWRDMMDHDRLDDLWQSIRFDGRYDQIDIPCLHVTGWYDLEDLLGAFHHYEHMVRESPAREQQRLLVGPWSHVGTRHPSANYGGVEFGREAAIEMDDIHLRWFDHWLKGIDNGVPGDAKVRLFEPGTNDWIESGHWPLAANEQALFLRFDGSDGRLTSTPPGASEPSRAYLYDPNDPAPTQLDVLQYPAENPPLDQTAVEARPDVLVYTSEPLSEKLVISGWPHLELFASSDGDDTEWHVKLTDLTPEGRSLKVSQGCLRASYRRSLAAPEPLTPGEVTRFDVELWPTHHAFLPGHRLRVTVTSSDFPWFARSMNRFGPLKSLGEPRVATNTIHHGASSPSRIRLPVVGH
ncbi:MAG TPA: CocE/NonD family hydrolase [Thermomicrobiaceae bacterium]|nr:CocE/NonD family hydrolase [Thermomicrobiaceae bacterium]